ncbi:hypothetical protein DVR12_10370 [Chitinophaga silvatica]|uniref:Uncharacterized protein n=1 Tax=Chitinophaga silvatica TaxID=2282649 RepID=A0A3E1YBP4_9BACT|nr:hypothetical protein [Chitinophaga silvatica]RFS23411.1 hypothetical protein DVR12_10370 [Chitinophaga silvatica]
MLRQFFTLTLPAVMLVASAQAQYPSDTASTATLARKKITLSKEAAFSDKDVPAKKIGGIVVVSQLWDTTRMGFLQVGMFNKKAEAVPDKPFSTYFQEYANAAFGNTVAAGEPTLLWIIEDLRIGERTGAMSEKAFTRLKATAYVSSDGKQFIPLASSDNAFQNGGMDVTHKHKSNIAKAFKELYLLSVSKLDAVLADKQLASFSYDEIMAQYERKRNIPVLTQKLNDGVYFSFNDFRENKPSITNFEVSEKKGAAVSAVESDGSKRILAAYWCIVKDGAILKKQDRKLLPLDRDGYGFTISSYIADYKHRNNQILTGAVIGGLAGGLISGAAVKLPKADAFPNLADPEATAIDMETGDLIF